MPSRGRNHHRFKAGRIPDLSPIPVTTRAEINRILARNLGTARQQAGFTQAELAKRSGIPRSTIDAIEHARVFFRLKTLVMLAAAMDLPTQKIFEEM